jgi:hypothetical protein
MKRIIFPFSITRRLSIVHYLQAALILPVFSSCNLLDVEPPSDIVTPEQVYEDVRTIEAAVNGLYTQNLLSNQVFYYATPFYLTVIADDAYHTSTTYDDLRNNTYSPTNTQTAIFWEYPYKAILIANDLLERLPDVTVLSEEKKQEYIGEAKYFRAYSYFVLTNLFGDVPWVNSTRILETTLYPRTAKADIVAHITHDLKAVEIALENSANTNTKVTKWAASALLARNYLYNREWKNAEEKADEVISTSGYALETLENVFLRSGNEAIFKTSSSGSWSSYIDRVYYAQLAVNNTYLRLTDDFLNAFEADDLRKTQWTITVSGFRHPYKYRRTAATSTGAAEDFVSLRLGEQYLIRAEARAQQDKLPKAIADLNIIRKRARGGVSADLPNSLTKTEVLLEVEKERRREFFAEEAHRWWDLVRTGRADAVLSAVSTKKWEPYRALLPVPETELDKNPNLAPQNPGYGVIR